MPSARTLHVRCTTWEQVDVFTTRKLRRGNRLSMKVPFVARTETQITLGLELPNQVVIAIDGVVQRTSPVETDGKTDATRTWIEIELTGLTDEVLARIRQMAKTGESELDSQIAPPPPLRRSTIASVEDLPADERELFQHLSSELRRLRQAPVHEVLGISRDAAPTECRAAWKKLVRRHHPDLVARRAAPAISHLAEELTILSNRAYDRLRAAFVVEGRGVLVGPTLSAPPGWLVGFDDMSDETPVPRRAQSPNPAAAGSSAIQGGEAFEVRARAMLAQGDANTAREVLAAALVVYPRSKALRSLYYVATALAALQDGELMLATAQLETALAHHEQCVEASRILEHIKKHGTNNADAMKRLFV